jgi:hypothetical protein
MADAYAGNYVLNVLLRLAMTHFFVGNIIVGFLIGLHYQFLVHYSGWAPNDCLSENLGR